MPKGRHHRRIYFLNEKNNEQYVRNNKYQYLYYTLENDNIFWRRSHFVFINYIILEKC